MAELRYNPLLKTYTIVASNRQLRPDMPKDWCPFCPGSGKVPDSFVVHAYHNDFPALSGSTGEPEVSSGDLYQVEKNIGACEVILYSPDHNTALSQLREDHIYALIQLWTERTSELMKKKEIKYIFVFENKGAEVGVTMPHPHGQIYGYPFIPLKLQVELASCKEHYEKTGRNLMLDINEEEKKYQKRVVSENDTFIAYIPFFTDYPYGVFISCKHKRLLFTDFDEKEQKDLAAILKEVTVGFDCLFDKSFPYMMCVHQGPVHSAEYNDCAKYFNFHIEFYPPLRDSTKIKYYASSEMGAWAATNTRSVEETAKELRITIEKII